MTPVIDVKHDLAGLSARLGLLAKERVAASVRALNRTMTTVRAQGARDLAKEYPGLKIAAIKKRMRFQRATRSSMRAFVDFSGKRFRLTNWAVRQTKTGVRLRMPWGIVTGGGGAIPADRLRNAFLQVATTNGVRNVFLRVGKQRYPLHVLLAPGLAEAFRERRVGARLTRFARARFSVVFQQEAKFRLSKR